jgi:S-adenosylmethionine/arginine decarboxylase-like enzyme
MTQGSVFSLETTNNTFDFEALEKHFHHHKGWGLSTALDCSSCNPETIRSEEFIAQYIYELCDLIDMKRFGDPSIVFFGEDPAVSGYSMTQLIETSLVSGHFVNQTNRAFIDIFSCKIYNPLVAATFTQKYFGAENCKITYILRGSRDDTI